MGYARPGLAGGNLDALLRTVADTAQTVSSTAAAIRGGAPVVSFATRYRWPLTIGISALFGAIAAYLARKELRKGRR